MKDKKDKGTRDLFTGGSDFDSIFPTGTPQNYVRCYESHPAIQIGKVMLYGGSCSYPMIKDADIYVGLDNYMTFKHQPYPWNPVTKSSVIEVLFPISDGSAPKDAINFIAMINWLAEHLEVGKKVHVGCIGGHGRTGMVIAALIKKMTGNADAITWVRENYCKKAVETKSQVKFLHKHFGIKVVEGTKSSFDVRDFPRGGPNSWGKFPAKSSAPHQHSMPALTHDKSGKPEWNKWIPGVSSPRSKGPRDLAMPQVVLATPLKDTPNNIWG